MTNKRMDRVAQLMQRKLAQLIQQEIKDPRLPSLITISAVVVTKDLGHAKVYFTSFNDNAEETQSILNAAAGYLRTALARTLSIRTIPQLHFVYDNSIEYARHLTRLIKDVNSSQESDE